MKNIILNETKILRDVLDNGVIENEGSVVSILIRHFLSIGMTREEVYDNVDIILRKYREEYNSKDSYEFLMGLINTYIKNGKFDLFNICSLSITETEWKRIMSIDDAQAQRLAFILLCYYKVEKIKKPNSDGWIKIDKTTLFTEAKIKVEKDCYRKLHSLYTGGYITTCLPLPGGKGKDTLKILFADEDGCTGKTMIEIKYFEDIIGYYYEHTGKEKYKICECCNNRFKIKKGTRKTPKYCIKCAKQVNNQKTKDKYKSR